MSFSKVSDTGTFYIGLYALVLILFGYVGESKRKSGRRSSYTNSSIPDSQECIMLSDTECGDAEYDNNGVHDEGDARDDDGSYKGHDEHDVSGITESDVEMDEDEMSTLSCDISTRHVHIREKAGKSYDRSVNQIQKRYVI